MGGYQRAYSLMEEIYENFNRYEKLWVLGEDPVNMHSGLGMHLRNCAYLWKDAWEPEIVDGVDYSLSHPDAISSRVIRDFQKEAKRLEALRRQEEEDD